MIEEILTLEILKRKTLFFLKKIKISSYDLAEIEITPKEFCNQKQVTDTIKNYIDILGVSYKVVYNEIKK